MAVHRLARSALGLALGALAALPALACSLDAGGTRLAATSDGDGAGPAQTSPTPTGADASRDAPAASDAALPPSADASAPADDAAAQTPADAGGVACDVDGDGARAAGGSCGGDDCCDLDHDAHPGQTGFFDAPNGCGFWDYDCNGKDDKEFGLVSCSRDLFGCSGDGFAADVACGATGNFTSCNYNFFNVSACDTSNTTKSQRCR